MICSVCSGTVAGAREAFLYDVPSLAISYDWYVTTYFPSCCRYFKNVYLPDEAKIVSLVMWFCSMTNWGDGTFRVRGKSSVNDFKLGAEACLLMIDAVLSEIKNKTYSHRCFLNIDLPTDAVNHKVIFRARVMEYHFIGINYFPCYNLYHV